MESRILQVPAPATVLEAQPWEQVPRRPAAGRIEPNLRRLRAYLAVYEAGSVQGASEQLHLAQSSLTRAVQELERPLGVALFERTHRGMVPTEFGTILAGRIRRALAHLDAAEDEVLLACGGMPDAGVHGASRTRGFAGKITHRQLLALVSIAENHTESDAARQLDLTPAAVNMALRELETRVAERLFHRSSRGMEPTLAGDALLRHAKLAFSEIAAAASDIAARAGVLAGRVVIGMLPLSGALLTPRAINLLLKEHPNLEISVIDGTYRALLQGLLCGDIDIIVGGLKYPVPPEIVQEELFIDHLSCVVRAGHPLARRAHLTPADLVGREWVLPRNGTPARSKVDAMLNELELDVGLNPIESNSQSVVRALLMETDRVAVISRHQIYFEERAGLVKVLPIELPTHSMPIGMRTRAGAALPVGVKVLKSCLRQVAADSSL